MSVIADRRLAMVRAQLKSTFGKRLSGANSARSGLRAAVQPILIILLCFLASGCGRNFLHWPDGQAPTRNNNRPPATTTTSHANREAIPASGVHVVQRGDTVYSIAFRYAVDFRQLARWNNVGSNYLIRPGQRLRLTPPSGAAQPTQTAGRPATTTPPRAPTPAQPAVTSPPASRPTPPGPRPTTPAPSQAPSQWRWPHNGQVVANYEGRTTGRAGLDIGGRLGDPITASGAGTVVYSGGGLPRYGQLVIIKHGEDFLSAYAYNQRLLVSEGQTVSAGEKIAEMGNGPKGTPILHFEIRLSGQPVDPLQYLPTR